MVEQSGEPFLLPFRCYLPHTAQPLGRAFPALCRGHVRSIDVLLSLRPSLPRLRTGLHLFVRPVQQYYGAVRLLLSAHVRRSVYGLRGPVLIFRPRRTGDLPVLVHVVSQRARVLQTTQDRAATRERGVPARVAFLNRNRVGVLCHGLFEAQSPRPLIPLSTLRPPPRDDARKS